jgi:hypothetical protein
MRLFHFVFSKRCRSAEASGPAPVEQIRELPADGHERGQRQHVGVHHPMNAR